VIILIFVPRVSSLWACPWSTAHSVPGITLPPGDANRFFSLQSWARAWDVKKKLRVNCWACSMLWADLSRQDSKTLWRVFSVNAVICLLWLCVD